MTSETKEYLLQCLPLVTQNFLQHIHYCNNYLSYHRIHSRSQWISTSSKKSNSRAVSKLYSNCTAMVRHSGYIYYMHIHLVHINFFLSYDINEWCIPFTSCSASNISVLGVQFRPGALVFLKAPSHDDYPLFGEIKIIIYSEDNKFLLVGLCETACFYHHYFAYCITLTDK